MQISARALPCRISFERFGDDCPAIDLRHHLRCGGYRGRMANLHAFAHLSGKRK
jgi:hypothetical protein